jgi:[ribosomal protein S5]-alanine N-acetyltransferase
MEKAAHVFDGLGTDRLVLRRFTPEDAADLHAYLSDASVYRWEPGAPVTLEEAKKLALERSRGSEFIAVTLKGGGTMVGHLYFAPVDASRRLTWELGYIFNPRHQGKGYASEAARALVEHAFRCWDVHRVMARCNPENTASWKLLERVGFRREGAFRSYGFVHEDGAGNPLWTDAYEYSLLAEDLTEPRPLQGRRAIILEYFRRLFGERTEKESHHSCSMTRTGS